MKSRFLCCVAAILLAAFLTVPAGAQLSPYSQDFESLDPADPGALAADGWLVFGNVFHGVFGFYLYGYGPFPAPNHEFGFSGIITGQGGPQQGDNQLNIYSDYNNGDHGNGHRIESNVFQEQVISAADVGQTWVFTFDAKRGNINDPADPKCPCVSEAFAFFKTLDPSAGFALTNFITFETTNLPDTWGTYWLSIEIDPGLVGQILQFGFLNNATRYEPSAMFYDNISFAPCEPDPAGQGYWHRQCLGVPAVDGGIDPGRNGRGPSEPTEPGFFDELMPCAEYRLEELGLYGVSTCEGMDANPPSDACERAVKQLTALLLNVCSEKVLLGCEVDVSAEGCGAGDVGGLIQEAADLIHAGECEQAESCAAAVNEGFGVVSGGGDSVVPDTSPVGDSPELDLRPLRLWSADELRDQDIWNVRLGYHGRNLRAYLVPASFLEKHGVPASGTPYFLVPSDFSPVSSVSVDTDAVGAGEVDRERIRQKTRR